MVPRVFERKKNTRDLLEVLIQRHTRRYFNEEAPS
jgi:hypothetical protein